MSAATKPHTWNVKLVSAGSIGDVIAQTLALQNGVRHGQHGLFYGVQHLVVRLVHYFATRGRESDIGQTPAAAN